MAYVNCIAKPYDRTILTYNFRHNRLYIRSKEVMTKEKRDKVTKVFRVSHTMYEAGRIGGAINQHKSRCLGCKYGLDCLRLEALIFEYKRHLLSAKVSNAA